MIKIDKATITITEQTVRELVRIIEDVKSRTKDQLRTQFTDEPMPDMDMTSDTYRKLQKERGIITIASDYSGIAFEIHIETNPHTQESLGYHLLK